MASIPSMEFFSSLNHLPFQTNLKPTSPIPSIHAVAANPNTPHRLLKELAERKKSLSPNKNPPTNHPILKPPLDDAKLIQRLLKSPQLTVKPFPLVTSCLPPSKLNNADKTWIAEYLTEAKQALGYPLDPFGDDSPAKHFDTLLYFAFQHPHCERAKARHVRTVHSRLWFLGQYVLELAFAEYFLQRYPKESPGPMRERVYAFIGKRNLPRWIKDAGLHNLVFPFDEMDKMIPKERESPVK